jgi:acetyl-CoA synthetase
MSARPSVIRKPPASWRVEPYLRDYARTVAGFAWDSIAAELGRGPGNAFNMAWLAVDRWARSIRAGHVALRCIGRDGALRELTYAALAQQSSRFANVLRTLGVARGERVFLLLGRVPELYVSALGALRHGAVVSPLFSAFGPEPLRTRLTLGDACVLVTTEALYRRRVATLVAEVPTLRHVLIVADGPAREPIPGTEDYRTLMAGTSDQSDAAASAPEDPALLHFTSGTTGRPKGALHVHAAALMHYMTGKYALDLHPDDVFWCTADPGWVTGTSYGILAPLLHGVTSIVDDGDFDAERWYRILEEQSVSVWYTAPTAIRMLMKSGAEPALRHPHPALRFIASVGEPLNAEAVWWGLETLGLPIHDNWWQTETGGIVIGNTAAQDIKPGSMGRPLPGISTAIVHRDGDKVRVIDQSDVEGELALAPGWPSMFRGYLHDEERYRKCFVGGWYLTGDLARRDAEGYYWFVGRADDVIKSAGHLIGPFEVESVLMEDPAVAEAGVIGKPDPVVGEMVKAFVTLKVGVSPGEELRNRLLALARKRLGAAIAPKEIEFAPTLPRTRSGKIMRRLLRARELGLPEGDTSTLEEAP